MTTTYTFDETDSGTDFVFGAVESAHPVGEEDAEPLFKLDPDVGARADRAEAKEPQAAAEPEEAP